MAEEMMTMFTNTKVVVWMAQQFLDDNWPPENALDFLAWYQAKLQQVPDEYRHTAIFRVGDDADGDTTEASLSYWRPETEEDALRRARALEERERANEAHDREVLAILKAKYEPSQP